MIIEGKSLIVGNHLSVMDLNLSKLQVVLVLKEKGASLGVMSYIFGLGILQIISPEGS